MSDDGIDNPADNTGFGDIIDELDEESSFDWDDDELESESEEETRPVVSVRIGDDLFAFPGDTVREIMDSTDPTPLPGAPPHVDGVVVVRRRVVGLLSMREFLNLPARHSGSDPDGGNNSAFPDVSTDRTLLVETSRYAVAIPVDEITGLDEWPESKIDTDTLPDNIRETTRRYTRGARRQNGTLCVLVDLETLLEDAAVQ